MRGGSPAKKILSILLPQTTVFKHQKCAKVNGDSCEFRPCNPCYLLCRRHPTPCSISVTTLAAWCLLVWDRRSVERLPPYLASLWSGIRRKSVPDVARSMLPYKLDTMLPRVAALHRMCFTVCMQQHAAHRRAAGGLRWQRLPAVLRGKNRSFPLLLVCSFFCAFIIKVAQLLEICG